MSLWSEMEKDGDEFLKEFGRVITFRGKPVVALIDNNPLDEMMVAGGMQINASFRVRFLAKTGSTMQLSPPKFGEQINIYGRHYTVVSITYRPPSPWFDTVVQVTNGGD